MSERRDQPGVTYVLIAANLAMFGYELAKGASAITPTPQQMVELGGNFAPFTLNGEWWRIVTSMFLHFGVVHIALNMVCLYQGRVVEQLYGRFSFLVLYLVAGLLGGVASLAHNSNAVSAGASGAVFGVYGAFGAFLVVRKAAMEEEIWKKTTRQIITFVAINLVYGMSVPGIDMSAHIGGLIGGFAVGVLMLVGGREKAARQRTVRALVALVLGVAVTAGVVAKLDRPPSPAVASNLGAILIELGKTEDLLITRANELGQQREDHKLTDAAFADAIEHEVLPAWSTLRDRMHTIGDAPARSRPLLRLLDTYLASRETAWRAWVAAARAPVEAQPALEAKAHDAEADVEQDLNAVQDEVTRLGAEAK